MTPKEKADEFVNKFETLLFNKFTTDEDWVKCVECALIAVDECINIHFNLESDRNGIGESFKYWQEVKQEIEKL